MTRRPRYANPWKRKERSNPKPTPISTAIDQAVTATARPSPNGKPVKVEFLGRIIDALDMTPEAAAQLFGVTPLEMKRLLKFSRGTLPYIDHDEMWLNLLALINSKLARILAVKEELNRKLYADAQRRAVERLRIEKR